MAELEIPITTEVNVEDLMKDVAEVQAILQCNNAGNTIDVNEIYEKLEELTYVTREERIEYVTTQLLHKAGIIVESSVAPENRVFKFSVQHEDYEMENKSDLCTQVTGQSGKDKTRTSNHVSHGNELAAESVPEFYKNTTDFSFSDISSQCENVLEHQSSKSKNSGVGNVDSEVLMEEAKLLYSFFPNYDIEEIYVHLEVYKDNVARIDIVTEMFLQVDSHSSEHVSNVFKGNNDGTNDKPGMILAASCFENDRPNRLNDCFVDQNFDNNKPYSNFGTFTEMSVLEQMTFQESSFNDLSVSEERGVNQNVEQFLTRKSEQMSQHNENKQKEVSEKFALSSTFSHRNDIKDCPDLIDLNFSDSENKGSWTLDPSFKSLGCDVSESNFNPSKTVNLSSVSGITKQIDSASSLACLTENCYSFRNTCDDFPKLGCMNNILTLDSSSRILDEECCSVKLSSSCDEINMDVKKLSKPINSATKLKEKSVPLHSSKSELLHFKCHSVDDLLSLNFFPGADLCRHTTTLNSETEKNKCGFTELNLHRKGPENENNKLPCSDISHTRHISSSDIFESEESEIILDSSSCGLNSECPTSLSPKAVENQTNEAERMDSYERNSESLSTASAGTCENMVNEHLSSMSEVPSEVTQNFKMPSTTFEDLMDLDFVIVQKSDVETFRELRVKSEDVEHSTEDYFEVMDAARTSKKVERPLNIYHIEPNGAEISETVAIQPTLDITETHVISSGNISAELNENIENKISVNYVEVDCNEVSRAEMSEKVKISSLDDSNKIFENNIPEDLNQLTDAEIAKVPENIEDKLLVVDIEDPRVEITTNNENHQVLDHAEVSGMTEKQRKLSKLQVINFLDFIETGLSVGELSAFGNSKNLPSVEHTELQLVKAPGNDEIQLEGSEICVNTNISETQQLLGCTEIQAKSNTKLLENIENQLILDCGVTENKMLDSFEVCNLHECNTDNVSNYKQNSGIHNFQEQAFRISEDDASHQLVVHCETKTHREPGSSLSEEIVAPGRVYCGMTLNNACDHENQDSEVNRNVAKLQEMFPAAELNFLNDVSLHCSSLEDAVNKICEHIELEQDIIIDGTSGAQCSEVNLVSKPHQGCRKKEISYNEFASYLSHLDPVFLQETWKKIGNNYGVLKEFMTEYKQETTEDQHYHTLLSLFPQAEPAFLRKTCDEIGNNEVYFQNFIEEQLQQDKTQARYYTLLAMFPQSDSAYLHAKSIEIGNDETAMRAFVVEQLEKNNGDDSYHALLAMFPEADPAFLRQAVKRIGDDEDAMKVFVTEQLEEMDAVKFETLLAVLPDADPDYLHDAFKRLGNNEESIKIFLMEAIESKNYPSREDYLKRQEIAALQRKYKEEFVIEDFLEMFPDPWKYFTQKNNEINNELIRKYETAYLESRYISTPLEYLNTTFQKNKYNLTLTCKELNKRFDLQSKVYNSRASYSNDVPVSFLQEVAFIENEQKIADFIKLKEQIKHETFVLAKANGELLECMCCYDTEVLAEDMATCIEGHLFCKDCIKKSAEVVIGNGQSSFRCLTDCSAEFSLKIIKMVLNPTVFSRMLQRKQLEEVQAAGIQDLESCPFCDFATILPSNDKVFLCFNPECMRDSCRKCKRPNHIPLRCDEVESKEIKMRTFIEDRMTDALVRTCWQCKKKFIKELGCNKMVCTCGAAMCYICRQPVTNYSHFNGQGGTDFHKCPLYSDLQIIHDVAVQEEGLKAKKEVQAQNPDVELKNDPTEIQTSKAQ